MRYGCTSHLGMIIGLLESHSQLCLSLGVVKLELIDMSVGNPVDQIEEEKYWRRDPKCPSIYIITEGLLVWCYRVGRGTGSLKIRIVNFM